MVNYKISNDTSKLQRKIENYNNEFELINVPLSHAWTAQNTVRFKHRMVFFSCLKIEHKFIGKVGV